MAQDTFTTSLRLQLQGTGNNNDTWGVIADTTFQSIEAAITGDNGYLGGAGGIDLSGVAAFSLSANNGSPDQARQLLYPFVGTPTGTCFVRIPGAVKIGWALNATNHTVILTTGGTATNLQLPAGGVTWTFFYCDGSNVTSPNTSFGGISGPISTSFITATQGNVGGVLLSNGNITTTTGSEGIGSITATAGTIGGTVFSANNVGVPGTLTVSGVAPETGTGCYMTSAVVVTTPGAWAFGISINAANGVAANAFFTTSDRRLKSEIKDISGHEALDWIARGRPRRYLMDGRPSAGFIAQEDVQFGRHEAVMQLPDDRPMFAAGDGVAQAGHRLTRDYEMDIAYLTKALQVALARIAALEADRA